MPITINNRVYLTISADCTEIPQLHHLQLGRTTQTPAPHARHRRTHRPRHLVQRPQPRHTGLHRQTNPATKPYQNPEPLRRQHGDLARHQQPHRRRDPVPAREPVPELVRGPRERGNEPCEAGEVRDVGGDVEQLPVGDDVRVPGFESGVRDVCVAGVFASVFSARDGERGV